MPNLHLVSLGCNKNLVDSEIMLGRLQNYAITDEPSEADVMIVNTCGFINSAKQESINTILNLAELKKKGAILVVTGCLIERYKDELIKELPEVDIFTGVGDYDKIDEIILKKQNLFSPQTYLQSPNSRRVITGSNYHAYIKIAEGCNQKCSFCAIPSFKGKLKSRSVESIADEVRELVNSGFSDFSFIAQDTSSFGRDLGGADGLIKLIDAVEKIKGVKVARILYLYPSSANLALIERIIKSEIFVNYFDMPIQHINDKMLSIMRRGCSKDKILELLNAMRAAKDSFLRTGVIVGHPGETDERFDELCEFINSFAFDRISAFAYSKEEGTLAAQMEQIKSRIIASRLNKIEKIINKTLENSFHALIGKNIRVQINQESSEGEMFWGAKSIIWDHDIDGEILINESEVENPSVGGIYNCEISECAGLKPIGKITGEA